MWMDRVLPNVDLDAMEAAKASGGFDENQSEGSQTLGANPRSKACDDSGRQGGPPRHVGRRRHAVGNLVVGQPMTADPVAVHDDRVTSNIQAMCIQIGAGPLGKKNRAKVIR
jgi:hypothetical protein